MSDKNWPAWRYGPGGASDVFESADDVPEGWQDHPSKVISAETTGSKPLPPVVDKILGSQTGTKPIVAGDAGSAPKAATGGGSVKGETTDVSNTLDRDGWPWTAELHSATQSQTNAGLWRMKVGASRPDPKQGFPKPAPVLDL